MEAGRRCLGWDVTYPDTLAQSHLNLTVPGAGAVANDDESHKRAKYDAISQTQYFIPIAVEKLGAFGDEAPASL